MKTIRIYGTPYELTDEYHRRIIEAMSETQDKLDKELTYSEDLQNIDVIRFYRWHIDKLTAMLAD